VRWLLAPLAALPTAVLHALAVPLYLLLYHVFRYRRAIVRDNLRHAFPEYTDSARRRIEKDSYRHLARLFLEILRGTRMREEEFAQRVSFANLELLQRATDNWEKQAIVLLIHQGNWEWLLHGAMAQLPVSVDPVYKTLHSESWDRYILEARSRFGAEPMTLDGVARAVIRGRGRRRLIGMVADQSGPRHGGYWTSFLNRPASFYRGAEKLARSLQLPLIFAQCRLLRTGHYEIVLHELSLPPHEGDDDDLLDSYVRMAEEVIAEQPETYLWTNRRWKKQPPAAGHVAEPETASSTAKGAQS
jgi:KDO2-lipid IV(A) lauroyltransferase